jgi:hypothetical protein
MQQNAMTRVLHPNPPYPYSSDLIPSDFYLFDYIKQLLLGCEFTDRDSLLQGVRDIVGVLKKPSWKASFATGWRDCTNLVQWVESMWSKESFHTRRISQNSLDPEMLMGGWVGGTPCIYFTSLLGETNFSERKCSATWSTNIEGSLCVALSCDFSRNDLLTFRILFLDDFSTTDFDFPVSCPSKSKC